MIFAEKVLMLRKRNGLSQEELAEKLDVSRQSISKWEGAQSIPDISKIIEMSKLFGVTLDFLLRDDIEMPEYTPNDETDKRKRISLSEANEYLNLRIKKGKLTALGIVFALLSPITLIELTAIAAAGIISMKLAISIGVSMTIIMITAAALLLTYGENLMKDFGYLDKEEYLLAYGVEGMVREKSKARASLNTMLNVIGFSLLALAVLPLIISSIVFPNSSLIIMSMLNIMLAIGSISAYILTYNYTITEGFAKLLCEGKFNRDEAINNAINDNKSCCVIYGCGYWLPVLVIYLGLSFCLNWWKISWIVWPVAGVIYYVISVISNKKSDK